MKEQYKELLSSIMVLSQKLPKYSLEQLQQADTLKALYRVDWELENLLKELGKPI
jgi:hypothetical protein